LWDADTPEALVGPTSYLPSRTVSTERLAIHGDDWTVTAGFLLRLSENWRLGGVYRQGSGSEISSTVYAGQSVDFGVPPGDILFRVTGVPMSFPDIYGAGLAYRSGDGRLTVSWQWDRIEYSDIPRSIPLDDQTIDDADELHIGAEYVFLNSTPIIALRAGAWRDPDHQMRATVDDPLVRALARAGDDELHLTAGLGIALDRFQVDIALDIADLLTTFSLSAIYAF